MTNKSLKILSIFTFVCVSIAAIIITSCEKINNTLKTTGSELIPTDGISIKDGALSFETAELFFKTSEKLGAMSRSERDKWEQSIGFTSMRKELNAIFDEITKCENENEVAEIVSKNSDLVVMQGDDVVPIIESNAYSAISNREGIFYVEGVIHKVVANKIISSDDGSIETLNKALSNLKSAPKGVRIVEYLNKSDLKSGECGTSKTAFVQTSDRKCDFELKTYKYYCTGCCGNYYYRVKMEKIIRNYRKNIWGNWKSYNTICNYKEVAYTIVAPIVTGFNGTRSIFYYSPIYQYFSYGVSDDEYAEFTWWNFVGDQVQNSDINTPAFDRVKGKASNRGVGDKSWAEIWCGAW
jgi:hypothetical protein